MPQACSEALDGSLNRRVSSGTVVALGTPATAVPAPAAGATQERLCREETRQARPHSRPSQSGEPKRETEEKKDNLYRSEREHGSFYRAVPLPEGTRSIRGKRAESPDRGTENNRQERGVRGVL